MSRLLRATWTGARHLSKFIKRMPRVSKLFKLARGASRRRKIYGGVGVAVVLSVLGYLFGNPFAGSPTPTNSVGSNAYKTSLATITRQDLTSQTTVSATLGFLGSYSIAIPSGVASSVISQDRSSLTSAQAKVTADLRSLADATNLAVLGSNATLLSAEAAVTSAEATLAQAQNQLLQDVRLGCPSASSATVGAHAAGAHGGSNPLPSSSSPGAHSSSGSQAPTASTGSASNVTSSSATLTGSITPNGTSTSYYFEYGLTSNFGSTTPSRVAGSGTNPIDVSSVLSGLSANTIYRYALVATNAAGTTVGPFQTFQTTKTSCVAQRSVIVADRTALAEAKATLAANHVSTSSTLFQDRQQLTSDRQVAVADAQALGVAQTQLTNAGTHFTSLAAVGEIITRGHAVYSLDGHGVPLFYGTSVAYRALYLGVADGPDVAVLNRNLDALGFGAGLGSSQHFSPATSLAVEAWQRSLGKAMTGVVSLGDYVVASGSIRVTTVQAVAGTTAQPGATVLAATSTSRVVTISLDASQQNQIHVGDKVVITLPNNQVTPGVVTSVGTVAITPSSGSSSTTPTVTVLVLPSDPRATGTLDQAPVTVAITTASARHVLVVPVNALLALAGGGYALEEAAPDGTTHLVGVTTGLFDDAQGIVQVSGAGLNVGQKIVIPGL